VRHLRALSVMTLGFAALSFLLSCVKVDDPHSHASQLTEKDYPCWEPSSTRLDEVRSKIPSGFIKGIAGDDVYRRLAGLPDVYIDYLIDHYKQGNFQGISERRLSPGDAGEAGHLEGSTFSGGSIVTFYFPTYIYIAPNMTNFALQHEVGHTVERLIKENIKNSRGTSFTEIESSIMGNRSFRSYSRSSPAEAFAELFASYYCSKESNDFVKRSFSEEMYRFMAENFVEPPWQLKETESDDIKLLVIKEESGSYKVYASTSTDVETLSACYHSSGVDEKSCLNDVELSHSRSNRHFYELKRSFSIDDSLYFKAFDGRDELISSREISLKTFGDNVGGD